VQKVQYRYEKAGLMVAQEPVPWNAEVVWFEASLQLPPSESTCRGDFELRRYGFPPVIACTLDRNPDHTWRIAFRLPPLHQTTPVVLCRRGQVLARAVLPFLAAEEFLRSLRLESPTFLALLGNHSVPCQAFVRSQCRGLLASGILSSPTSLLPLADLTMALELTDLCWPRSQQLAISLNRDQLTTHRALVSVPLGECLEGVGTWTVQWTVAGRKLAALPVRMVSRSAFEGSLFLIDSRFVFEDHAGAREFSSYLPGWDGVTQLGPCFRLASRIPGMAGLGTFQVRTQPQFLVPSPSVHEHEILVTDGPSPFIPFVWAADDFRQLAAVELCHQGQCLGRLAVFSTPVAKLTGEGGFEQVPEFDWTPLTEQEMNGRLSRLMVTSDESVASSLLGRLETTR
jgi:hypothetical protein